MIRKLGDVNIIESSVFFCRITARKKNKVRFVLKAI